MNTPLTPLPLPFPFCDPIPAVTRSPAALYPPRQDEHGKPRGNWVGGEGNMGRAETLALAENGAERRRRQRKQKGQNHCGC